MSKKIALQGFSRVKFFPILTDDTANYEVGIGFDVPEAQEMTREADISQTKIYADDRLYLDMKSWNGLTSTITLAEMTLQMMADLGFGKIDTDGALNWNPQGENKAYAVSFRCLRADGNYRMSKMYSFTVTDIAESNIKTKGDGTEINAYKVTGTFTARKIDDSVGDIKDSESSDDFAWLDTVTNLPTTP